MSTEKPLDLEQLVRRCLGRIDLAERLLKSFETRFPADLSKIEECLRADDSVELSRLVHQLKGTAANVSAPDLHAVMTRMEQAVKAEQPDMAHACLEEVHRAWERYQDFKSAAEPSQPTPTANSGGKTASTNMARPTCEY
jgi:HPt (histidine-containing phosphotransfer) domain-containing protein